MANNRNQNQGMDEKDQGSMGYDQDQSETGQKGGQAQQSETEDIGGGGLGETDDMDEGMSDF